MAENTEYACQSNREKESNMCALPMDDAKARIDAAADHLHRITLDYEGRFQRSRSAGQRLANAVQHFVEDPDGVGTNWLLQRASEFLARDAGNFGPMSRDDEVRLYQDTHRP